MKALSSLEQVLSPSRSIAVAREISKMFEETIIGTVSEARDYFEKNHEKARGEFVVVVSSK